MCTYVCLHGGAKSQLGLRENKNLTSIRYRLPVIVESNVYKRCISSIATVRLTNTGDSYNNIAVINNNNHCISK